MQHSRSDMLFHTPDVRWQTDKRTKIHSRRTASTLQQLNNKSSHWQCVKSCLGSNIFWLIYHVELGFTVREVGREAYIAWGEAEHCIFLKNLLRVSPSCSSITIFLDQFWWIPLAIPVCCEVLLDYIIMWHKYIYTTSVICGYNVAVILNLMTHYILLASTHLSVLLLKLRHQFCSLNNSSCIVVFMGNPRGSPTSRRYRIGFQSPLLILLPVKHRRRT